MICSGPGSRAGRSEEALLSLLRASHRVVDSTACRSVDSRGASPSAGASNGAATSAGACSRPAGSTGLCALRKGSAAALSGRTVSRARSRASSGAAISAASPSIGTSSVTSPHRLHSGPQRRGLPPDAHRNSVRLPQPMQRHARTTGSGVGAPLFVSPMSIAWHGTSSRKPMVRALSHRGHGSARWAGSVKSGSLNSCKNDRSCRRSATTTTVRGVGGVLRFEGADALVARGSG
jgi:hypothetical protein